MHWQQFRWFLIFLCLPFGADAASYYSRSNGSWNDASVWSFTPGGPGCNSTPQGSDDVVISHTVVLQKHLTNGGGCLGGVSANLYITSTGSLNGGGAYDLNVLSNGNLTVCGTLVCKNIEFFNGSVFRFCQGSNVQINGNFINRNNSPNIQVDGQVQVQGGFENGVGAYIGGNGSFVIVTGPAINQGTIFTCIGMYPCSLYACLISSVCGAQVFLPVEWASFSVTPDDRACVVEWTTASEINADRFEVQRSSDGVTFESVGAVPAHGTSSVLHRYSYRDRELSSGTYYYRIRQSDFDGKYSYSVTEAVIVAGRSGIAVVPNPVRGNRFRIEWEQRSISECRIALFDPFGRSVYESRMLPGSTTAAVELPIHLSPGSYLLLVNDGVNSSFEHLVVEP